MSKLPVKSTLQFPDPPAVVLRLAPPGPGRLFTPTKSEEPAGAVPDTTSVIGSTASMVRGTSRRTLVEAPSETVISIPGTRSGSPTSGLQQRPKLPSPSVG